MAAQLSTLCAMFHVTAVSDIPLPPRTRRSLSFSLEGMPMDLSAQEAAARTTLANELRRLQARNVLVRMAERGQLIEIRCETPKCYYQGGRRQFLDHTGKRDWWLSVDHYPKLKRDGGRLDPWNVRLAHVRCNRDDDGWRKRINALLTKGKSLEEIAKTLNAKHVTTPHGTPTWTAAIVRKELVA
jgi:hypothetical protein